MHWLFVGLACIAYLVVETNYRVWAYKLWFTSNLYWSIQKFSSNELELCIMFTVYSVFCLLNIFKFYKNYNNYEFRELES